MSRAVSLDATWVLVKSIRCIDSILERNHAGHAEYHAPLPLRASVHETPKRHAQQHKIRGPNYMQLHSCCQERNICLSRFRSSWSEQWSHTALNRRRCSASWSDLQ